MQKPSKVLIFMDTPREDLPGLDHFDYKEYLTNSSCRKGFSVDFECFESLIYISSEK